MKENRTNVKIFKAVLLMFVSVMLFSFTSLTAQASYTVGSGEEEDTKNGSDNNNAGGPTYRKTGWLIYVVDRETGAIISPSVVQSYNHNSPPSGIDKIFTRFGGGVAPSKRVDNEIPWGPFDLNGNNGEETREWLKENGAKVVADLWGPTFDAYLCGLEPGSYAIVAEGIYWNNVFINGKATSKIIVGTARTIAEYQMGVPALNPKGDFYINSYTNNKYARCAHLNTALTIANYPTPKNLDGNQKLDNTTIATEAWGCVAVWTEGNQIPTWDEPTWGEVAGPAPDHPKGNGVVTGGQRIVSIVKSYYTEDLNTGAITDDGCYIREDTPNDILILDEPLWRVEAWVVSDSDPVSIPGQKKSTWRPSVPGNTGPTAGTPNEGDSSGNTKVGKDGKTLFVLLRRVKNEVEEEIPEGIDYTIRESQITKAVWLSEAETNLDAKTIKEHIFNWRIPKFSLCPGHLHVNCWSEEVTDYGDSDGDGEYDDVIGHHTEYHNETEYCSGWSLTDSELAFALKDELLASFPDVRSDNEDVTWNKRPMIGENESEPYTRKDLKFEQTSDNGSKFKGYDMRFVILRGKDKLTLSEFVNADHGKAPAAVEQLKSGATSVGWAVGNKPADTRKNQGADNQDYSDSFDIHIVDASEEFGDNITKAQPSIPTHVGDICSEEEVIAKLDPMDTISPINVYIETYSGMPDGGKTNSDIVTQDNISSGDGPSCRWGMGISTGTSVSFYPYIAMRYDTTEESNLPAFVMGQYSRSFSPADYAEILWSGDGTEKLTLDSKQWSTHASAINGGQWHGQNQVLPGGATMNLQIKESDRQQVMIRTYQTILTGWGREQVEKTTNSVSADLMTDAGAKGYHEDFVNSVMEGLDALCVDQWANKEWSENPFSGKIVKPGVSLGNIGGGGKCGDEDKYYFRGDGGTAQDGDLDVRIIQNTQYKYFSFYADTKGDIYCVESNSAPSGELTGGYLVCSANSRVPSPGAAKEVEDRTKIITKLAEALERGTGNDSEAANTADALRAGNWYNEAFDGITVVKAWTVVETGFADPATRVAVLDVKLSPKNSAGQSGLFKGNATPSQFKTHDSTIYGDRWVCGIFSNNSGSIDIKLRNMDELYTSKKFYIPNVNVQDTRG